MAQLKLASGTRESRSRLDKLRVTGSKELGDFIDFWWDMRTRIMQPVERQAFLQVAWVLGNQTHGYDRASTELVDNSDYEHSAWWHVNAVENRLLPMMGGRLSKLLARQPIWKVLPATSDEEDGQVAAVSTRVLRHYWQNVLGMAELLWEAHWWAEATGTAYLVTTWDPDAGQALDVDLNGIIQRLGDGDEGRELFRTIFGDEAGESAAVPLGEPNVEVHTLFEVFVDPVATRIKTADFALISRLRSMDYLEDHYGRRRTGDLTPGGDVEGMPFYARLMELGGSSVTAAEAPRDDLVLVKELWVKRSKKRPKGIHAVFAQGKELRRQPNPYEHGEIPIAVIHGERTPVSLLGTCKVAQLMETQGRFNTIRSNKTEYMDHHVWPKILDPDIGVADDDSFTTAPGERITYTYPYKPEYLQPPPMPRYLDSLENDALQAFQDLGDIHEVSTGQAPDDVKSGKAILALQAQDEARFGPVIKLRNGAISRVGRQVLSLLRQFVSEERLIQIVGDDNEREIDLFTTLPGFIGSNLVGRNGERAGADYFRVTVEVDSELPLSPEGQRAVIGDLVQNQVLNPQADRDLILRLFGLGAADPIFEENAIHRSMAIDENRRMAAGETVEAKKYNNHAIHIPVVLRFMNSPEFGRLPPDIQQRIENHLVHHQHLATIEAMRPALLAQISQKTAVEMLREEVAAITQEGQEAQSNL